MLNDFFPWWGVFSVSLRTLWLICMQLRSIRIWNIMYSMNSFLYNVIFWESTMEPAKKIYFYFCSSFYTWFINSIRKLYKYTTVLGNLNVISIFHHLSIDIPTKKKPTKQESSLNGIHTNSNWCGVCSFRHWPVIVGFF